MASWNHAWCTIPTGISVCDGVRSVDEHGHRAQIPSAGQALSVDIAAIVGLFIMAITGSYELGLSCARGRYASGGWPGHTESSFGLFLSADPYRSPAQKNLDAAMYLPAEAPAEEAP